MCHTFILWSYDSGANNLFLKLCEILKYPFKKFLGRDGFKWCYFLRNFWSMIWRCEEMYIMLIKYVFHFSEWSWNILWYSASFWENVVAILIWTCAYLILENLDAYPSYMLGKTRPNLCAGFHDTAVCSPFTYQHRERTKKSLLASRKKRIFGMEMKFDALVFFLGIEWKSAMVIEISLWKLHSFPMHTFQKWIYCNVIAKLCNFYHSTLAHSPCAMIMVIMSGP